MRGNAQRSFRDTPPPTALRGLGLLLPALIGSIWEYWLARDPLEVLLILSLWPPAQAHKPQVCTTRAGANVIMRGLMKSQCPYAVMDSSQGTAVAHSALDGCLLMGVSEIFKNLSVYS